MGGMGELGSISLVLGLEFSSRADVRVIFSGIIFIGQALPSLFPAKIQCPTRSFGPGRAPKSTRN